jgi:hypothetical protein
VIGKAAQDAILPELRKLWVEWHNGAYPSADRGQQRKPQSLGRENIMSANVFRGKVARVDLSTGDVRYEKVREEDARLYIGARGWA